MTHNNSIGRILAMLALICSIQSGHAQINVGGGNSISGTYSSIAGGDNNTVSANNSTIGGGDGALLEADHSFIGGGLYNSIFDLGVMSFLGGGFDNGIYNYYGVLGGGAQNKIYSTNGSIVGGFGNIIATNGLASIIGAGGANTISNAYAVIGGGTSNVAFGAYSTIPGGRQAKTVRSGQFAIANGAFATAGDAQMSVYILRGVTTGDGDVELFLDGTSERLVMPENASWLCDFQIVSRGTSLQGNFYGNSWRYEIPAENQSGTIRATTLRGITWNGEPTWDASSFLPRPGLNAYIQADSNVDALCVIVNGNANETVHWVCTVRVTELIKP